MRYRRGLGRQFLIAIIFVIAVATPVYFISDAYLDREGYARVAQVAQVEELVTVTLEPTKTPMLPPTWTPEPSLTPLPTFTSSPTPTELFIPNTGYDFSNAYIDNVVHLPEGGGRTMVTIVVPGNLNGEFYAEVLIESDSWDYKCVMIEGSEDHLFCFGDRLPGTDEALILVYEVLEESGESVLVYEAEFEVVEFVPTKTHTPVPPRTTATNTPTPTNTLSPLPTVTNTPTNTPMGPPPSPWVPTDTPAS